MINCLNCTKPRLIETDTGHTHCSMTCEIAHREKNKLSAYKEYKKVQKDVTEFRYDGMMHNVRRNHVQYKGK